MLTLIKHSQCVLLIAAIIATLAWAENNNTSSSLPVTTKPFRLPPVVIPKDTNHNHNLNQSNSFVNITNVAYTSKYPHRKMHWVYTNHHFSVVNPPPPSSTTNSGRLFDLWKPSHQAHQFGCDVAAVNGGPYHADGTSCGPLVVDGKLVQNVSSDWIGIGITDQDEFVLGNYHEIMTQWHHLNPNLQGHRFQSFVTGFHWLLYNGSVVANDHDNEGGGQGRIPRAARTAVGVADDGTLVLLVVDGCEKCLRNKGLSLTELATHIQQHSNLRYAINLDGGGSSTLIYQGRVQNRPMCLDIGLVCERPVASVICLDSTETYHVQ